MTVKNIAYLGDSLTDSNRFWSYSTALLSEPLPSPSYYAMQFSNDEVHADKLTRLLALDGGDPLSPTGDYNYAVAGSRAVGALSVGDFIDDSVTLAPDADLSLLDERIDLTAQSDRLLADAAAGGWALSEFSVVIWIGLNDLANWEPDSFWPWNWPGEIDDLVDDIIAATRMNVQRLLAAGIGEVWVATQPDESFFPVYDTLGTLTQLLSDGVIDDLNDGLKAMVAGLGDARVRILDIEEITDEVEADPANFRMDIEEPILLATGGDADPVRNPDVPDGFDYDDYGFIDYLHPTDALHGVLAIFEAEAMTATLIATGTGGDAVTGTAGDDLVLSSGGSDAVALGDGDDVALGGTGHDLVEGDEGSDLISGGSGRDTLMGGDGDDLLTGGHGDDSVNGGRGRDLIIDTAGFDTMDGGRDADVFLWFEDPSAGSGFDRINGGKGKDHVTLFLADTLSWEAAVQDFEDARGKRVTFDGLRVSNVESFEFIDLSQTDELVLPALSDDLLARVEEWDLWHIA